MCISEPKTGSGRGGIVGTIERGIERGIEIGIYMTVIGDEARLFFWGGGKSYDNDNDSGFTAVHLMLGRVVRLLGVSKVSFYFIFFALAF